MSDGVVAAIRTGTAVLVTGFLAWVASTVGIEFSESTSVALEVAVFGLAVGVYNFAVNLLTTRVSPIFGYLLAVPKNPTY